MDFFLFLLVNFTLFVRPSELVPDLAEVPIYNVLIVAGLIVSASRILEKLRPGNLIRDPITFCVLGLLLAAFMSHMVRLDTIPARYAVMDFSKSVLYYLLLISVVNSLDRLRTFLSAIAIFATIGAVIAILHYYSIITVPSLSVLEYNEIVDAQTGATISYRRIQGTGLFSDPNDLSMIAVVGLVIAASKIDDRQLGLSRLLWLVPLLIMVATVGLTKSRGGTLALGAAIMAVSYFRFGLFKSLFVAALFLPVAAAFVAGRGDAMESGTGRSRVELWSAGIQVFKGSPVFGAGWGRCAELIEQEAHNSFVHCFVELGMFGGALFLGAFAFGVVALWKLREPLRLFFGGTADASFYRLHPYMLALICGSCISMFSISRSYIAPTYMLLGIVDAYILEAQRRGLPPVVTITGRRLAELLVWSVLFLVVIYIFIRVTAR